MRGCSFSEWQPISRKSVRTDPSHVTEATQRDHSNFAAMKDVLPEPFPELMESFASQRSPRDSEAVVAQQSNFLSKKKVKPAEKMLKGQLGK